MTWNERFRAAGAFASAAWRWLALAGLVLVMLLLARACDRAGQAEAEAKRLQEANDLARAGLLVARQESAKQLAASATALQALQAELERVRAASPGVRVVTVEKLVTAPMTVGGIPRSAPWPGPATAEIAVPQPNSALNPVSCLLAEGDTGDLRVSSMHLETRAGNQVVIGWAEAWRLTPPPATTILAGPISGPLSTLEVEAPLKPKRWGAGAFVGASRDGWTAGPAVAFPPLRIWSTQFEATAGAGLGPSGTVQVGGTAIIRW